MQDKPKNSTTDLIERLNDNQADSSDKSYYEPEFRRRMYLEGVSIVDMGEDLRRAYMWEH